VTWEIFSANFFFADVFDERIFNNWQFWARSCSQILSSNLKYDQNFDGENAGHRYRENPQRDSVKMEIETAVVNKYQAKMA